MTKTDKKVLIVDDLPTVLKQAVEVLGARYDVDTASSAAEALEKVDMRRMPVHLAKKKIPYVTADGKGMTPQGENGYKFEYLVLDLIKLMKDCLPYEVIREKEFAPIKNRTGVDSVETAQALLEKNGICL